MQMVFRKPLPVFRVRSLAAVWQPDNARGTVSPLFVGSALTEPRGDEKQRRARRGLTSASQSTHLFTDVKSRCWIYIFRIQRVYGLMVRYVKEIAKHGEIIKAESRHLCTSKHRSTVTTKAQRTRTRSTTFKQNIKPDRTSTISF